jgi:hypothetical protein
MNTYFKEKAIFILIILLILAVVIQNQRAAPEVTNKILTEAGYSSIELTGAKIAGFCAKGVPIQGFKAKNKAGEEKSGYVCDSLIFSSIHED